MKELNAVQLEEVNGGKSIVDDIIETVEDVIDWIWP